LVARERYTCSCGYMIKTGLICEHIIKILWETKEYEYENYLS